MTMSLVGPYLTTTNYKKRKQKGLTKRDRQAQIEHEKFLKKMGISDDKPKQDYRAPMPDYSTGPRMTSDRIAGNGTAKERMQYTGDEIAGIVTTHKSNLMPVRKDNKKAFVDAAQMRRN